MNASRSTPEPRETRAEPRTPAPPAAATRPAEASDSRATEMLAPDSRPAESRATDGAPRASVLGPTLRFKGELSAQEDLVVQGTVEGSITHTQSLTIGSDGSMKGNIRARVIFVDGKVDGDLYATESVTIRASAKVKGNVFAPRVAISEGAFFQGQVEMQPTGAAVQEHSTRVRQSAKASAALEDTAVDQVLSGN